jgi:hypothetical protein
MLNIATFSGATSALGNLKDANSMPEELFSVELVELLQAVRSKRIDNLIIRGLPAPYELPQTPKEIHRQAPDIFPKYLIEIVGRYLGEISEKGIENSIRFSTDKDGSTNVETWHGHPQFSYSVFFCLRGDENAKTYFLSANDIIKHASDYEKTMLLSDGLIRGVETGYEFSEKIYQPSDFQQFVENLDLLDTTKALNIDRESEAYTYLLKQMADSQDKVVYHPGDIAIYNERQTMRFSPSYAPSTKTGEGRWLLGVGVY